MNPVKYEGSRDSKQLEQVDVSESCKDSVAHTDSSEISYESFIEQLHRMFPVDGNPRAEC